MLSKEIEMMMERKNSTDREKTDTTALVNRR